MHPLIWLGFLALIGFSKQDTDKAIKTAMAPPPPPRPRPTPAGTPVRRPAAATNMPPPPSASMRAQAPKLTIEHPDVNPAPAAEQAAVDAAVSHAIREMAPPAPAVGPAPMPPPAPIDAEVVRTPKEAATALLKFLIATGRFGSKTDRVPEIAEAQRDLGITADGIIGPATRKATKAQGIALPVRH